MPFLRATGTTAGVLIIYTNGMDLNIYIQFFDDIFRLLVVFVSYHVLLLKNICAKLNENTLIILMPTRRTQKNI